jgi:hypothetical protein
MKYGRLLKNVFDMRHHMYLHALLKNLRVFHVTSRVLVPYVKVGSTKACNKWNLSSQHVPPTIASFFKVAIKALILAICHLLFDGLKYPCEFKSIPRYLYSFMVYLN